MHKKDDEIFTTDSQIKPRPGKRITLDEGTFNDVNFYASHILRQAQREQPDETINECSVDTNCAPYPPLVHRGQLQAVRGRFSSAGLVRRGHETLHELKSISEWK